MRRLSSIALAWLCGCSLYDARLLEADLDASAGGRAGTAADGGEVGRAGVGGVEAGRGGAGQSAGRGGAGRAGSSGEPAAGSGERAGAAGAGAAGAGAGGAGHGGAGSSGVSGGGGQGGTAGAAGSGPCVPSASTDCCPEDPNKQAPGSCGCGVAETDSDLDTTPDCVDPAPYGWQHKLTLDGAQISGALTDFPLLVQLTQSGSADGSDIYFTAADQHTLLDFELESYAPGTGALVAWVRMPSLSAGSDASLYLGYGDGRLNRANAAGVWGGYQHVWHLAQDPSLGSAAIRDATERAHGTAQGGMAASALVPGIAGQGLQFDGSNDEVTFTNDVTGTGATTLSGWVKQAADSGDNGSAIISLGSGTLNDSRFLLCLADQQKIKVGFYGNDKLTSTILPLDAWKHVAWVWTGSQSTVYVDGAVVFGPTSHTNASTSGSSGSIGGSTFGYPFFMTGVLDEVRVATAVRSPEWLTTEFNNQRPSSTFIKSTGAQEAAPSH